MTGNEWIKWGLVVLTVVDIGVQLSISITPMKCILTLPGFNLVQGILSDFQSILWPSWRQMLHPYIYQWEPTWSQWHRLDSSSGRDSFLSRLHLELFRSMNSPYLLDILSRRYRNSLHNLLGEHRPSEARKVLLILIESGGKFLIIQVSVDWLMPPVVSNPSGLIFHYYQDRNGGGDDKHIYQRRDSFFYSWLWCDESNLCGDMREYTFPWLVSMIVSFELLI